MSGLKLNEAADLLAHVFFEDKRNWQIFIAQNIHGLTPGLKSLRPIHEDDEIYFDCDELEYFAMVLAKGLVQEDEIERRVASYFSRRKTAGDPPESEGEVAMRDPSSGFLGVTPDGRETRDFFTLTDMEAMELGTRLRSIEGIQRKAANILLTIGTAFSAFKTAEPPSTEDIDAIKSVVSEVASDVSDSVESTNEIINEIWDRFDAASAEEERLAKLMPVFDLDD